MFVLLEPTTFAQGYSLDGHSIACGGGTSTAGVYSVTGTVGQSGTGEMVGGNYALVGGFWSAIAAVQTEGAPRLSVTLTNNAVVLSWPAPADGWGLQTATQFVSGGGMWTEVQPPYQTNTTSIQFTAPLAAGNHFYRLTKP